VIPDLVEIYDAGAITAHHLAVQCLHVLDPAEPELVLAGLPDEVLAAVQDFADGYDPNELKTNYGVIPPQDQVVSARKWIREKKANVAGSE
jgi:hypothetical protein